MGVNKHSVEMMVPTLVDGCGRRVRLGAMLASFPAPIMASAALERSEEDVAAAIRAASMPHDDAPRASTRLGDDAAPGWLIGRQPPRAVEIGP